MRLASFTLAILFLCACAKERPIRKVSENPYRVAKSALAGNFLFLKSMTQVHFNDTSLYPDLMTGKYMEFDRIARVELTATHLRLISVLPLFRDDGTPKTNLLAEIPIEHVDIVRRENSDGKKTHIEERDQSKRPWNEREFVELSLSADLAESLSAESVSVIPGDSVQIENGAIQFHMDRTLKDGTQLRAQYSLLPYRPNSHYQKRAYTREEQRKFGFFKTRVYQYDGHKRITDSTTSEYLNRWDLSAPIALYYSAGFPSHLKPAVQHAVESWNETFKKVIGQSPIELRENSGQALGDLRYNVIHYDEGLGALRSVAFSPGMSHPETGQILKADVILFGGAIRRAIFRERCWENQIEQISKLSPSHAELPAHRFIHLPDWLPQLKLPWTDPIAHRSTSLEDAVSIPVRNLRLASRMSDEEVELEILKPLIVHELGHFLGLRHNFMASSDTFEENDRSASAMDYGFLTRFEPLKPGRYDAAALEFAYTDQKPQGDFLYCTDEQALNPKYGRCFPYDTGRSLVSIATSLTARYHAAYAYKNHRADATHFEFNLEEYASSKSSFLYPLRVLLDHASTIVEENNRLSRTVHGSEEEARQVERLWALLQGRIEAPVGSDPTTYLSFETPTGRRLNLDRKRLQDVLRDAAQAQLKVFEAVEGLLVHSKLPDHNHRDLWDDRMMTVGILPDKLIALQLLGMDGDHPLDEVRTSPFQSAVAEKIWNLFRDILSNTPNVKKEIDSQGFDPNLRHQVVSLLEKSAKPGHAGAWFVGLAHVRPRHSKDDVILEAVEKLRIQYRALLQRLNSTNISKEEATQLEQEIDKVLLKRREPHLNLASFRVSDTLELVAPIALENKWETASGRLIRDNLNTIEDKLISFSNIIEAAEVELRTTDNPLIKNEIERTLKNNRREQTRILAYLESERRFLLQMFNLFQPSKLDLNK